MSSPDVPGPSDSGAPPPDLEELRTLLLQPDREKIRGILQRLDDADQRAAELTPVLPKALARGKDDQALNAVMGEMLGRAVDTSIKRNRSTLAEALFPIMGPAIRKAVGQAIADLVETLNRAIEYSFTRRGIQWRIEAMRTGKSVGEIALSHSLIFRVEQVFLIHRETGVLLQQAGNEETTRDSDLMSSMLTAIQDFVKDSFSVDQSDELDSLQVGELRVWIERGPKAILAAAIRGNPPVKLRTTLQTSLEAIHAELATELEEFTGETAPYAPAWPHLEACLKSEFVEEESKKQGFFWAAAGGLVVALLVWIGFSALSAFRWNNFVEDLREAPGITVLESEDDVLSLYRDPQAADPLELAAAANVDPDGIDLQITPHLSLEPEIVVRRAAGKLAPPDTVDFRFEDGTLYSAGRAFLPWAEKAAARALEVAGVESYEEDGLKVPDRELKQEIEAAAIRFALDSSALLDDQGPALQQVGLQIQELARLSRDTGRDTKVRILGQADPSGTAARNRILSRRRAEAVYAALTQQGVPEDLLNAQGVARAAADSERDYARLRSVVFEVELSRTAETTEEIP